MTKDELLEYLDQLIEDIASGESKVTWIREEVAYNGPLEETSFSIDFTKVKVPPINEKYIDKFLE